MQHSGFMPHGICYLGRLFIVACGTAQLGGTLQAQSDLDQGTAMTLRLPLRRS